MILYMVLSVFSQFNGIHVEEDDGGIIAGGGGDFIDSFCQAQFQYYSKVGENFPGDNC